MIAWRKILSRRAAPFIWFVVLVLVLCLAGCSGGTRSSGNNTVGGVSSGSTPTSGEYLLIGAEDEWSYSTINTVSGAIGSPVAAGGPADNAYPPVQIGVSGNYAYAIYTPPLPMSQNPASELETFQMTGPGVQLKLLSAVGLGTVGAVPVSHPSGKFLYVILQAGNTTQAAIQEFSINNGTGALTAGGKINPATVNGVLVSGVIDPTGRYLYTIGVVPTPGAVSGPPGVFAYQINQSDGSLTAVANSPFTVPLVGPAAYLAIGGSGNSLFLYVDSFSIFSSPSGGGIAAFSIDNATGALASVPSSPFLASFDGLNGISVDPSGRFLYGVVYQNGSIRGYVIDQTTGALSPVPGSPFSSVFVQAIAIDPSGKFLYAAGDKVYGFSLNAATGSLSALAGSPFPDIKNPGSLVPLNIP